MKKLFIIALILSSCSSVKKTLIYSSLAGGTAGAATGLAVSPNKNSRAANALVWGLAAASAMALIGYLLYKDDPRNFKLKEMLIKSSKGPEIDLGNIKIDAIFNKKEAYPVPTIKLPEKLKGKIGQQYLIKYQSIDRYHKVGNKTYYIPAFEIYEYSIDDPTKKED